MDWTSAWAIGYLAGIGVVVVVVVLLLALTSAARRTAESVEGVAEALRETEQQTAGLWRLESTRAAAGRLLEGFRSIQLAENEGGRT